METIQEFFLNNLDFIKLLSIPFVSGIVGWGTNFLAIKMTFYPLEFKGLKLGPVPLGWQGIIPSKAKKMATISVDLMTTKLISVEEVIGQLDPVEMAKEMRPYMIKMTERVMTESMVENNVNVWEAVPRKIKDRIFDRVSAELPALIEEMMVEIKENVDEVFDLKKMVIDALMRDKQLMVDLFLKCGAEEFKFIERSGFYFGFLFGMVQMAIWFLFPLSWILPLFGFIVGLATNWLALKLIFQPEKPKKIGPWTFQGLFIKRQMEVADEYAKIVAKDIINSENIYNEMLYGKSVDRLIKLVKSQVTRAIETSAGYAQPFMQWALGGDKFVNIKKNLVERIVFELPKPVKKTFNYTEKAFDIENMLRTRLQALTPSEFVQLLRPAFQEEELTLILVGGGLGLLAGIAQLYFVFGGSLL